jgi:hypothetical protein
VNHELDPDETTLKITTPHLKSRAARVRRLANLSCFVLATYALLNIGHGIPTVNQVWLSFLHRVESFIGMMLPS